jgi:RHS repeat-associated protein
MTYTPSDSTWLITNAAGDEVAFYGYDAFGNLAFGTPGSPFGYAGEYTDPCTGFSNLRARWFESQTGTFTSRDPSFDVTDTAYIYAEDDPINATDPSGLIPVAGPPPACGSISGLVCIPVSYAFANPYIAQAALRPVYGGYPKSFSLRPEGRRDVDIYNPFLSLAVEVKIGRQVLPGRLQDEANKDVRLRQQYCNGYGGETAVCSVMWSFWPSEVGGTRPSTDLVNYLRDQGIQVQIFYWEEDAPPEPIPGWDLDTAYALVLMEGVAGVGVTILSWGEILGWAVAACAL